MRYEENQGKKKREKSLLDDKCARIKRDKERSVMIILSTMSSENYPSFVLFLAALPSSTEWKSQKYSRHKCLYLSQFNTTIELHHSLCQEA